MLFVLAAANGWEIHHLDVKTVFLHRELTEDVYVSQPEGLKKKGEEHKIFKLRKALYELRQASPAWNMKLDQVLKGFKVSEVLQGKLSIPKGSRKQNTDTCHICG